MIKLITYDLRSPGKDYTELYVAIKRLSPNWIHPLESVWLVQTNQGQGDVANALIKHMDKNDQLIVSPLTTVAYFGLAQSDIDFLKLYI